MNRKTQFADYRKALILFVASSLAIVCFVPRSNNFNHRFVQGLPWMHEDLFAPFDFPVYKSTAALSDEKKHTVERSLRYFALDSMPAIRLLNSLVESDSSLKPPPALLRCLEVVTGRGILDETLYSEMKDKTIAVLRGNVYEEIPVAELFTPSSAYEYLQNFLANNRENIPGVFADELNRFSAPNLVFDERLTAKIQRQNLDAILPTEGMVSKGTKIVARGERIDHETFRLLSSLKREYEKNTVAGSFFIRLVGCLLFVTLCMSCIFAFLKVFRRTMLTETKCLAFTLSLLTLFVIIAMRIIGIREEMVYAVPLTIVPIYISSFFYSRPAIYVHFFMIFIIGGFLSNGLEFIIVNSLAGVTAVIGFKKSYERGHLFLTGFLIFIVYLAGYTALQLFNDGNPEGFSPFIVLMLLVNSLLVIILYQFTFLFERLFGFVSISRLVELSDTNRKLLRDLTERAPGTAQHALQVANIAEAVIREIGGGDPLLVRTGALYHDIGKMRNPGFFIENQPSNISPHESISAEDSAKIIIEHVTYGIELARKYNLPAAIVDFIKTHHGKSKVHYFYSKHINEFPDDSDAISKFSYPGPNPATKETVAVMMADTCEAASRSLPHPDENALGELVDKLIERQYSDGLYNDSNITLREINTAKRVIKTKLKNMYHARIAYPGH